MIVHEYPGAAPEVPPAPVMHEYNGLRREAPPETVSCPVDFTWSRFGASYPDTQCQDGLLFDLDSDRAPEEPCPICNPESFYDGMWGGGETIPTCAKCEKTLPSGTAITFSENGDALEFSAPCPTCNMKTWTLMRVYPFDADDTQWEFRS